MLASLMVIVWSAAFIQRKHGAAIFLLLSAVQFLVGGGFAQIFLVVVTAAAATQINAPLNWFRAIFSVSVRRWLAKLWMWLLLVFALVFSSAIFAAIFGYLPIVCLLYTSDAADE